MITHNFKTSYVSAKFLHDTDNINMRGTKGMEPKLFRLNFLRHNLKGCATLRTTHIYLEIFSRAMKLRRMHVVAVEREPAVALVRAHLEFFIIGNCLLHHR